jgi:hypothetical protein
MSKRFPFRIARGRTSARDADGGEEVADAPVRRGEAEAGDLRQAIQEEDSGRNEKVAVLKRRIREFDDEHETNRVRHEAHMETLGKRRDALARQIALLTQPEGTPPGGAEHPKLAEEKALLESQIAELNSNTALMESAIAATVKESNELQQLLLAIPSENEEIVQIARRQIARKIQSETYAVQLRSDDLSVELSDIQADLQLSKVVSAGLKKENSNVRARIAILQSQLTHYEEERVALVGLLQASAGHMPLSDLTSQLRDLSHKIHREGKELDSEFTPQIAIQESEIGRLTAELDRCPSARRWCQRH